MATAAVLALSPLLPIAVGEAADRVFFESRVRPVLAEHCYGCHSAKAEKLKGGLRVDSLNGLLTGGDSGPAIVPGNAADSLLIKAIGYTDANLEMPPKGKKLAPRQIADLTHWVQSGAPWPDATAGARAGTAVEAASSARAKAESWWAFQPVRSGRAPDTVRRVPAANPIDAFVQAALEAKGLTPNPPARRRELIRRAYFDLTGLPPTPEQVADFEQDRAADAWPRLIDRLLSLPQYGERWGRHWLDVVRFAQSNGYERDGEKPEAWRYRDYVIKAFNEDKPYDQFVREQIAGDELEPVTFDSIIATGFQRLGVWDDEPDDKRMAEFDELDDVLATTGNVFLGLTLGCARCHEHKFDPIPQSDYYALLGFFRNLRLNEAARYTLDSPNYVPLAAPGQIAAWRGAHTAKLERLEQQRAAAKNQAAEELLRQIENAKKERPPFEFALAVRERGPHAPPTHVLIRGSAGNPGAEVQPAFLEALGGRRPALPVMAAEAASSGRRLAFATWVASPGNPLSARVMVNRIWHYHFGRGLVQTTSDFGRAGTLPTHPQLLDWLAAEFVAKGWSIKELHRVIMSSQVYQRSSRADNAQAMQADPGNDLLWRQNLRRLDAEALRDSLLAICGNLNLTMSGRGFFPRLSGEVLAGQSRPGLDWDVSSSSELARRSVYAYVRRTMPVPMLDAFDYSNTTSPLNERPVTTVAPQALLLLNDAFMQEQAAAFAKRLRRECRDVSATHLIERAFLLAVGRPPTAREAQFSREFINRQESAFTALSTRLTFRPDVPTSLSVEYMNKLSPEQFLIGPKAGWKYYRGSWSEAYEGIRTVERDRGPFALATTAAWTNGTLEVQLVLHAACETAGVLFRASAHGHDLRGYEVALSPRDSRVALRRHDGATTTLAEASVDIPTARPLDLKLELKDARLRVWLGSASGPTLEADDRQPFGAGGLTGVRAWGAAISIDDLEVRADGAAAMALRDEHLDAPAQRAMQAFCLLLLNVNEVVYVD